MKTLRSHIIKVCILTVVTVGLCLPVAQPAEASCSNREFALWLNSVVKKTRATNALDQKLARLKNSHSTIDQLIEQASQIVSKNNNDFNLPLSSAASNHIYQILLAEWNQFQSGNAMAAVPPVQLLKPFVVQPHQKDLLGSLSPFFKGGSKYFKLLVLNNGPVRFYAKSFSLKPLSGGCAIGAP